MKTQKPDHIAGHYVTKPAAALLLLFLQPRLFRQKEKPKSAYRPVAFDSQTGHQYDIL